MNGTLKSLIVPLYFRRLNPHCDCDDGCATVLANSHHPEQRTPPDAEIVCALDNILP